MRRTLLGAAFAAPLGFASPLATAGTPNQPVPVTVPSGLHVYPGCPTPPTTFAHTWYFDPVNGQSEATMTSAGISLNPA
jgi:hypothetical protein